MNQPIETRNNVGTVVIRAWEPDGGFDAGTYRQAHAVSKTAGVVLPVMLMPDAHVGNGSCVGSVIATAGSIIVAAVGVDLGCGMSAARLGIDAAQLPDNLTPVLSAIAETVPTTNHRNRAGRDHPSRTAGLRWLAAKPIPSGSKHMTRAAEQLGTLGGGNHFVELSVDNHDQVWLVLHSGSRGTGNLLARQHIKVAAETDKTAPSRELASLREGSTQFEQYRRDMLWSQEYAYRNREVMLDTAVDAVRKTTGCPIQVQKRIRCHHNYAETETRDGQTLWITRKGAVRARKGDVGIIPGSMGDSTFIVEGLGNQASYQSAAHGAGRAMIGPNWPISPPCTRSSSTNVTSLVSMRCSLQALCSIRAGVKGPVWQRSPTPWRDCSVMRPRATSWASNFSR